MVALTDDMCLEAVRLWRDHGENQTKAADSLGLSRSAFQGRLKAAQDRGLHLSSGARGAIETAGLHPGEARHGWRVIQHEDGSRDSVFWKADDLPPEEVAEKIRAAFEGMTPAPHIAPPPHTMADLCTVYPMMDVHYGMHAWGRETGGPDYDLKTADSDMHHAFGKISAITPDSTQAILIIGGDFFHADDNRSETPAHRHKLDVDTRHWKVLERGIEFVGSVVAHLLAKHANLLIRVLRGNHDEHAHLVLTFALTERYRMDGRVSVDKDPRDLFMQQWGRCLISSHHGDKAKPEQLTHYLADVCPFWSDTRHRYCLTGHIHHDRSRDIGGLRWESLRAFAPADAYAAGMGYSPRRALQSLTFDKKDGLVLRAIDPIER